MEAPAPTAPAPGDGDWTAGQQVAALPEMWALFAEHIGDLVEAWRLMRVCKAAEVGGKGWLRTLPGLVVCGRETGGGEAREVLRLDLATMRWAPMPSLVSASAHHACCVVRGALVVLGGRTQGGYSSRVQILSAGAEAFVNLPSLSCGKISDAAVIAVEESESAAGQVLLLGGYVYPDEEEEEEGGPSSSVHLVDLATGVCTPQPGMLCTRYGFAAVKMEAGRIVCEGWGGPGSSSSAEVFRPPLQGAWTWRALPGMSVGRFKCCGCVMSDGRFAVFGGLNPQGQTLSTCEALVFHGDNYEDARWVSLAPMHNARSWSMCATVAGCVIVVGGWDHTSCKVYHEARGRWLRLPCDVPCEYQLYATGSAMLL
jgi:hypothetical protein